MLDGVVVALGRDAEAEVHVPPDRGGSPASSGVVDEAVSSRANDTNDGPRTQLYSTTRPSWAPVSAWNTAASNRGPRKYPMTGVEINQSSGAPTILH